MQVRTRKKWDRSKMLNKLFKNRERKFAILKEHSKNTEKQFTILKEHSKNKIKKC